MIVFLAILTPVGVFLITRPVIAPGVLSELRLGAAPARGVAPQVGYEAPPFQVLGLDGQVIALRQFRGRPVLLNFWATWCAPCRLEMPHIESSYRQYQDRGLVVLAVSTDSEGATEEVRSYIAAGSAEFGSYTFSVGFDPRREVARAYKLFGLPTSFFIDRQGVIRELHPGEMVRATLEQKLRTIILPA